MSEKDAGIEGLANFVKTCGRIADLSGRPIEDVARVIVIMNQHGKATTDAALVDLLKQAKSQH